MIDVQNLSVLIQQKKILKNITVNIAENDFWLIFGPNGAGKTTLLKTLAGQIKGYSGSVLLDGNELSTYSKKQISQKMAFLPQEDHFNLPFRVYDILMFGRYPYHTFFTNYTKEDRESVLSTAKEFGIDNLLDRDVHSLSGGEKKKALIASAFLQNVSTFLLDEPFNFLDPPSIVSLLQFIKKFHGQGKTIIVVSHFIEYFFPLTNKILALKEGKMRFCGDKTFDNSIFHDVYGVSYMKTKIKSKEFIFLNE